MSAHSRKDIPQTAQFHDESKVCGKNFRLSSLISDGRSGAPDIYVAKTRFCHATGAQVTSIPELSPVSQDFSAGRLWPNPASDGVNIMLHLSRPQMIRTEVYDLQGKLVKSVDPVLVIKGTHEMQVEVTGLTPGQYILKVVSDTGLFATRMLYKQ